MTYPVFVNYKNRAIKNMMSPNKDADANSFDRSSKMKINQKSDEKEYTRSVNNNHMVDAQYITYNHQMGYSPASHSIYDNSYGNNINHHGSYQFQPDFGYREQLEYNNQFNHNKENVSHQSVSKKKYNSKNRGISLKKHPQIMQSPAVKNQETSEKKLESQESTISNEIKHPKVQHNIDEMHNSKEILNSEDHSIHKDYQLIRTNYLEPNKQYNFINVHNQTEHLDRKFPAYRAEIADSDLRREQEFLFDENNKKSEFNVMGRADEMRDYDFNPLGLDNEQYMTEYVKDYENFDSNRPINQFNPNNTEQLSHTQYEPVDGLNRAITRRNAQIMLIPKPSDHLNPRCFNLPARLRLNDQNHQDPKLKMKRERNRIAAKKSRDKRLSQYQNLERIQKSQKETIRVLKNICLHLDHMLNDLMSHSETIINEVSELMQLSEKKFSISQTEFLNNLVLGCYNFSQNLYDFDMLSGSDLNSLPSDVTLKINNRGIEKFKRKISSLVRRFRNINLDEKK